VNEPAAGGDGLAAQQAALVAALVEGSELPAGFDEQRLEATRAALLRKRAGEVATAWPLLAASYGTNWPRVFTAWAGKHAPNGSLRDGWDFARSAGDALPSLAREELSAREQEFSYDGTSPPRRKRRASLRDRLSKIAKVSQT
jgi:hypothetical protein